MRKALRFAAAMAAAAVVAGCGGPGSPLGPPSPQDIFAKPAHASSLKDAHFIVGGKFTNQGKTVALAGDGALVYKSGSGRFKFQASVAGQQVSFEDISVNGTDYTMTIPGSGKWVARASASALGPNSFTGASGFKYVAEETLPQGRAWHVAAKDKDGNPFDGWIRKSDGYPVKYVITQQGNTLTLTFDKYNTGEKIAAPPASQVVKG
jgi:outer membrane lipoprotein-sorting protein